ncbi:hypothetical protein GCM10023340_07610 [Nocardioides marinquilinus]|uniref:non-specific serine/threonine protein kinase n=1 Tax=Nocardioides marinquilinus TaxID=1210400 RepID=A0ABP9P9M6_9ACTN
MTALPRVGDQVGRYRIDSVIGRGGMGVVLGATDTSIGRRVALKVLGADLGHSEEFRRRFEREAAVLARLDSPHVIAIYDYGTHEGAPYIATQYVGGGDLGGLLQRRGPMPTTLALSVCAQLAEALDDAHRVGVVHRDVKPTNVLLRDADSLDLHAYLCDFGIARTASDGLTAPGAVAGTWSYLSPECGRGAPGSPASDVYALGCLLWATLTGSPPYRGTDVEIAVAHQQAPVPQLVATDDLGRHVNAILQRSLAKDPAQRYRSADEMRLDLLSAAGRPDSGVRPVPAAPHRAPTQAAPTAHRAPVTPSGSGTGAPVSQVSLGPLPPRVSPPTPHPTGRRRRSAGVIAAVCAAVVLVAGGVVVLTQLGGDDGPDEGAGPTTPTSQATDDPTDALTGSPTTDPTTDPDPEPEPDPGPQRLDEGGPITGDVDGDGLGDLRVDFSITVGPRDRQIDDETTFLSTGSRFAEPEQVSIVDRDWTPLRGDFDGDGVGETLAVRTLNKRDAFRFTGDLSGGGSMDAEAAKREEPAYVSASDVDGDGDDDVVLLYLRDYEEPPLTLDAMVVEGQEVRDARPLLEVPFSAAQASIELGDFDGDGRGDVAVMKQGAETREIGEYRQRLTLWRGAGDDPVGVRRAGTRELVTGFRPELLVGDLDGDEDDELLSLDYSTSGTVEMVDVRRGGFTRTRVIGALSAGQASSFYAGVSDVNGDGLDDVVGVAVTGKRRAVLLAGVSDGSRLVSSRWGRWNRSFFDGRYIGYFDFHTRTFR